MSLIILRVARERAAARRLNCARSGGVYESGGLEQAGPRKRRRKRCPGCRWKARLPSRICGPRLRSGHCTTLTAQDASIVASDLRGGSHKARATFRAIPMANPPPVALSALLKKLMFLLDSAASKSAAASMRSFRCARSRWPHASGFPHLSAFLAPSLKSISRSIGIRNCGVKPLFKAKARLMGRRQPA
jgi:hypothetical protein